MIAVRWRLMLCFCNISRWRRKISHANVGEKDQIDQIDQIDNDLDHLYPTLLLWYVVQDLCGTDPTQEACTTSCRLYGAPTQQHELGNTDHTDQDYICPAWQTIYRWWTVVGTDHTDHTDLTDHISEVCSLCTKMRMHLIVFYRPSPPPEIQYVQQYHNITPGSACEFVQLRWDGCSSQHYQ